jgi:hypothetical protein
LSESSTSNSSNSNNSSNSSRPVSKGFVPPPMVEAEWDSLLLTVSGKGWPSFLKWVLGSSEYERAQGRLRRLKASNDEVRWAQGVVTLADEILNLTPTLVEAMKKNYLQELEEAAKLREEETELTQDV